MDRKPHVLRMIQEHNDLADKTKALGQFLESDQYKKLLEDKNSSAHLLKAQHSIMFAYAEILGRRLDLEGVEE